MCLRGMTAAYGAVGGMHSSVVLRVGVALGLSGVRSRFRVIDLHKGSGCMGGPCSWTHKFIKTMLKISGFHSSTLENFTNPKIVNLQLSLNNY